MTECQDTYGVMIERTLNFKQYQNDPTLSGVYPVHVFFSSSFPLSCFCFDLATTTGTAITLAVFVINKSVCVYVCVCPSHPLPSVL